MAMVSHNGNIRHCSRSALRPVGIPPILGRHSALTRQFSLVGIPPVGIRARTPFSQTSWMPGYTWPVMWPGVQLVWLKDAGPTGQTTGRATWGRCPNGHCWF